MKKQIQSQPSTFAISDSLPDSLPTQMTSIASGDQGIVSLYIQGRSMPLRLENEAMIVLGRRDAEKDTFVTVDLTPMDAQVLGVSRHHAVIHLHNGAITVDDLGSTNGTFINDQRVQPGHPVPLHSGDKLRLGKMVIIFVFYLPQTRQTDFR